MNKHAVEAFAVAGGAGLAVGRDVVGIKGAQGVGDLVGAFVVLVGRQHPVIDAAVAAAGRAPTLR